MDKAVEKELRLFKEALPGIKSGNDFNKYVRIVEKFDEKSYSGGSNNCTIITYKSLSIYFEDKSDKMRVARCNDLYRILSQAFKDNTFISIEKVSNGFSSIIYIERNTDKGVEIIQSIIDTLKEFYQFKKKKDMVTRKVIIEYSNEI